MMKNVAIINSCNDGSTGKIAVCFEKQLRDSGFHSLLCYGRGLKSETPSHYRIDTVPEVLFHAFMCRLTGYQGYFSRFATWRLIRKLRKENIDTVYGIGLHGYYLCEKMFFNYLIKDQINFVYVMTEEYAYLGRCGYSADCTRYLTGCGRCPQLKEYPKSWFFDQSARVFKMKKDAYPKLKRKIFVAPEFVIECAKKSPLMNGIPTAILDESIDLSFFYPRDPNIMRRELNIDDSKIVILCIAPMSYPRKGCKYFVELAKRFVDDNRYIFVHVGFNQGDKKTLPVNYIAITYEADQERLACYYSMADLFVFPSFLDTMPNACLEALACGSPLLCFDTSGMPYIANREVGTFVELGNVDELARVVRETKHKDKDTINRCRKYAESRYDNREYYKKLISIGESL